MFINQFLMDSEILLLDRDRHENWTILSPCSNLVLVQHISWRQLMPAHISCSLHRLQIGCCRIHDLRGRERSPRCNTLQLSPNHLLGDENSPGPSAWLPAIYEYLHFLFLFQFFSLETNHKSTRKDCLTLAASAIFVHTILEHMCTEHAFWEFVDRCLKVTKANENPPHQLHPVSRAAKEKRSAKECSARSEFLFCLSVRVLLFYFRVSVVNVLVVISQNNSWYSTISLKNRRFGGNRATKTSSAGTQREAMKS